MDKKNLFTEKPNPNDMDLGNDFVDLDEIQSQENRVASDDFEDATGNINSQREFNDRSNQDESQDRSNYDFSFDQMDDDEEIDSSEFPVYDEQTFSDLSDVDDDEDDDQNDNQDQGGQTQESDNFVKQFNEKYKTDFKTQKEVNDFIQGVQRDTEQEDVVTPEERQTYDRNKGLIDHYDGLINQDDKSIIRSHEIIKIMNREKRKPTEDEMEIINDGIERLEENGTLELKADHVRGRFEKTRDGLASQNGKIDEKITTAKKQQTAKNQERLISSLKDIYLEGRGNYLGVKVTTEDLQAAFNEVKSGGFIEGLLKDPKRIARLALIDRKFDEISKVSTKPGYSDGIDEVLNSSESKGKRLRAGAGYAGSRGDQKRTSSDAAFAK